MTYSRPIFAAAGVAAVLFAGFFAWIVFVRDTRTPLEIEYTALNSRDLGDPAKISALYTVSLVPGNLRDSASTATHQAGKLSETIIFRLGLDHPAAEGSEYSVSIERSDKTVFSVPNARVFRNPFGSEVRLMAPRSVLPPGQYQILVSSAADRDKATAYLFRIE